MKGVLLMAYGGPASLDEVEPYLADVRGGRAASPELVAEVRERYRLIGGRSPLLDWTRRVAEALQQRLDVDQRVFVGMRHWHPYIEEAVREAAAAGVDRLVAIPMSPYDSRMSVGAYADKLAAARQTVGAERLEAAVVRSWHLHAAFVDAVRERLETALRRLDPPVAVLFTAHSLPARILQHGDPYPRHLEEAVAAVARAAGLERWHFAYQSPGRTGETWLSPFAEDVVDRLHGEGVRRVLVVPIGFLCDHVEILYDLDVMLTKRAAALGVELVRTESLNDSPRLVDALEDVVRQVDGGRPRTAAVAVQWLSPVEERA